MELRIRSGSQWECGLVQYHQLMEVFGYLRTGAYLNARYEARDAVAPSIDLHIQKTDAQTGKNLAGAVFEISMDGQKVALL